MMYINQNPFSLNDLIVSTTGSVGAFQPNSVSNTAAYNILPATASKNANSTTNYQANKANNYCLSQQSVGNLTNPNRSTSVSSTGSTSSVSSTASSSTSSPSSSASSSSVASSNTISYNKITNNSYNPYNFAYYNPTLTTTNASASTTTPASTPYSASTNPLNKTSQFISSTQLLPNGTSLNGLTTSGLGTLNTNSTMNSYNTLNEKCMLFWMFWIFLDSNSILNFFLLKFFIGPNQIYCQIWTHTSWMFCHRRAINFNSARLSRRQLRL